MPAGPPAGTLAPMGAAPPPPATEDPAAGAARSPAAAALAGPLLAGLTDAQLSRLADLRGRVRRGAFAADGGGTARAPRLSAQRRAFARWLVRTGRLHEGLP
jgi:hypothetical protein